MKKIAILMLLMLSSCATEYVKTSSLDLDNLNSNSKLNPTS